MLEWLTFLGENQGHLFLLLGQHLFLLFASIIPAAAIGLGLGVLAARPEHRRRGRIILSVCGAAQAVPSVAIIALAFLFVGIGALPALIALVLYSIVPVLFNTTSGLLSVPPATIQAARGMGLTPVQILWKIELPLAFPVIMAGLRSAATINVGAATVASFIGGGGLGDLIFAGLKLYRPDMIFTGSLLCALLAIAVDMGLGLVERRGTRGVVPV